MLADSVGHMNAKDNIRADQDCVYLLGSLSKTFVAAAIGILVHERKMNWTDLVSKHVLDFDPVRDPRIARQADIMDLLFRSQLGSNHPRMGSKMNRHIASLGCYQPCLPLHSIEDLATSVLLLKNCSTSWALNPRET